ncbi:MAG: LysM peptidoglycan-binding domain-containing protein [Lysinibacillus sp.]
MKKFIYNNQHIILLAIIGFIIIGIVYITDEKVEQAEITVEYGDTLWTLSELYRGKMSSEKWIAQVKKANNLQSDQIVSGEQLTIPIEENSYFVAYKKVEQYEQKIEVASDTK